MNAIPLEDEIYYPESDGEPMAESELHLEEMIYLIQGLQERFRDRPDVFVGGNLFLYHRKGDPRAVVAPDAFVVEGVPKKLGGPLQGRRKYLLWEEGEAPRFVAEVTSESTRKADMVDKKGLYERLGVEEYFLFDPEGDHLDPRLQGFRLRNGRYRPVPPMPDGSLTSTMVGLVFQVKGLRLHLEDTATGAPVLRNEEQAAALRAEIEARRQAEKRVQELELELARLRSGR